MTSVLERAMIYLQQTILPETLDAIVCCLQQAPGSKKYRAFVFNKTSDDASYEEPEMQDFSLSIKKDIILCKLFLGSNVVV